MEKFSTEIGGQTLEIEIGGLAQQSTGEVLVKHGETTVLVTAVMSPEPKDGGDFFPLTLEYQERFYAAGRIRGSRYLKREGKPSDEAILNGRLIDRAIRPRFNQKMRNEVQIVVTCLSWDAFNDPDLAALLGASLALSVSPIPWQGPVAAVRVGESEGNWVLNPSYEIKQKSGLDLVMAGDENGINMIEAGANQVSEERVLEALEFGHRHLKKIIEFQKEIIKKISPKKITVPLPEIEEGLKKEVKSFLEGKLEQALFRKTRGERMEEVNQLKKELLNFITEKFNDSSKARQAAGLFEEEIDNLVHEKIIDKEKRVDGRKLNEIREIDCRAGYLPRTHGSGLFTRGTTQVLSILTLGAPGDKQLLEGMEIVGEKRFFHHYNFPPYSVGEIAPFRGPGRREIGHGALVERALGPLVPTKDTFPYTIRVVSEVLSSNGSSSMASVCASSLALMDAGVPIKEAAAGIAMGLMVDKSNKSDKSYKSDRSYKVLTDIQGPEDHHGDMDFKVAGTKNGINAIQMDVKVDGVTRQILKDVFSQTRQSIDFILEKMAAVISQPRPELSPFAPRILTLQISPEKIREVIGPGGKVINSIIEKTGVAIDIEDTGLIYVTGVTGEKEEAVKKAISLIKGITREVKVGEILEGTVRRIVEFGAFVEIAPGQEGLVHISELAPYRVGKVSDVVKIGQTLPVKVIGIDDLGRINLSLKQVSFQK